jgi:cell wall-associated NlpC family hydrolase
MVPIARRFRRLAVSCALAGLTLACATAALAGAGDWAAPQIRAVTKEGVLGSSPANFAPQAPLTQAALADAIRATDDLQHSPEAAAPTQPAPNPTLVSSIAPNATIGGLVPWQVDAPGRVVDHVDFALDGKTHKTDRSPPYDDVLDTRTLPDGLHQLAVNVTFADSGSAIAAWTVTVANAAGAILTPSTGLVTVTVSKASVPPPSPTAVSAAPKRALYRAVAPAQAVSIKQLDAALVGYLGLGDAARAIQATLKQAGLNPPANTGSEAVARMLELRLNHPAGQDELELRPYQAATRAEAAWSFAQVLRLDSWATDHVRSAAESFTLPTLTSWQRTLLTTAIHYVGYPYVWGGTSPASGFDCSGYVWRVVKLTPYAGEGGLANVLRGRTTYQMSGEVSHAKLLPATALQPADVMFFGSHGRNSKPSEVDHTALYLGNGWFVQSSGEGVTLLPFDGWYTRSFAWARRPLREAGLG